MTYGPGGNLWRTICDVDFTAEANQDIKAGGGSPTIGGMTWTRVNGGNCTNMKLVNGTGLVIDASATNTLYSSGTRTSPMITLPFGSAFNCFPPNKDYSIQDHVVRMMCRVLLTNADTDFEDALFGVEDLNAPTNQHFMILKGRNGGDKITFNADETGTEFQVYSTATNFTDDVLGLNFEAPDLCEAWTGVYDTAAARLPYEFNTHRDSYRSNIGVPLFRLKTHPIIFIGQETGNVSASLTTTFTHFRVDVCAKSPPR